MGPRRVAGLRGCNEFGVADLDDVLKLARNLDVAHARALAEDLATRRGRPLVLDAADVEKTGAFAVEVLIAARLQWAADGVSILLRSPSAAFRAGWQGLGLDPETLGAPASDEVSA